MNWDQLRDRIDRNRCGDKVDFPDPAVSPLGTDEEAGGSRTPPEDIAHSAKEQEWQQPERPGGRVPLLILLALLAVAAGVLTWLID
ncbi:hypothetical protein [Alkalilimnicola ehrlichii]|nr:hypothetical protein [Alkalilimnicola ehrlichii]